MGTQGVVADALRLTRLAREDPGLALLRTDLGPMVAAILAEHLGGQVRRLPVAELHELVDEDLAALREAIRRLKGPPSARESTRRQRHPASGPRTAAPSGTVP